MHCSLLNQYTDSQEAFYVENLRRFQNIQSLSPNTSEKKKEIGSVSSNRIGNKSFRRLFSYGGYSESIRYKRHGNKCIQMRRHFRLSLFFGLVMLQLPYSTLCLRDLLLSLPPAVSHGDTVNLNCSYHLQGEELYTINLYKGRHEFLQYVPEMSLPLKQFHRKGINIHNITLEGTGKFVTGISVIFNNVTLFTSGLYSCEASASPSFHTELVRKRMTVLVKPNDQPIVIGFKPRYRVGDTLGMVCYVNDTFPAANITWFINGKRIDNHSVVKHEVITSPVTRLETSKSVLSLPLKPKHFLQRPGVGNGVSGQLRAKCLASMLTMHWQTEDIVIKEESPTLASVVDSSDKNQNSTGLSKGGGNINYNAKKKVDSNFIATSSSSSSSGSLAKSSLGKPPGITSSSCATFSSIFRPLVVIMLIGRLQSIGFLS